ncbi:MAG: T9SS type A sorting domain-containing protein [Tannerellaceae bacterium]|nr:T9SS type A sorting domain-containing protein [Tannerellaceae bacterium]
MAEASPWSITEAYTSALTDCNAFSSVLVGDIDGDGTSELFVSNWGNNVNSNKIYIINSDGTTRRTIDTPESEFHGQQVNAVGRVKWNAARDTTLIFYNDSRNRRIKAYSAYTGALVWTSDSVYTALPPLAQPAQLVDPAVALSLADLDGDGYTEIVSGNRVFAAETGKLLCKTTGYTALGICDAGAMPFQQVAVADVLKAGYQQICIGMNLYRANGINSNRNLNMQGSMAIVKSCSYSIPDGCTQVVDLNLDGNLDLVVSKVIRHSVTPNPNNVINFYVWSPNLTGASQIIGTYSQGNIYKRGVPFIGNIDKTPYPEIIFVHGPGDITSAEFGNITAVRYTGSTTLSALWHLPHEDSSGSTGITLFDFNQDGIAELVYRDELHMRIINGSLVSHKTGNDTTVVYNLSSIPCGSGTGIEYPTVADIDNDGQAEIIVIGPPGSGYYGPIRIFKAGAGGKWAPARKVWNQFAYNSVNVNKDLTIPAKPYPINQKLNGPDGLPNTSDDAYPFNSFLQQQTMLNQNGNQLWLLPDVGANSPSAKFTLYQYDPTTGNATVWFPVKNFGDAEFKLPMNVSIFTKTGSVETYRQTQSIGTGSILADGAKTFSVILTNISGWISSPGDSLILYVNRSNTAYVQKECVYGNNRFGESFAKIKVMMDDTQTVQKFGSVEVDVLGNDGFGPDLINLQPQFSLIDSVILQPRNGKLVGVGSKGSSKLVYINSGAYNLSNNPIDSFKYRIRTYLGGMTTAAAYIYILDDENGGTGCAGQSYTISPIARPSGTSFDWYSEGGSLIASNSATRSFSPLASSTNLLIKPINVGSSNALWNRAGGFPRGLFTVHASPSGERMRWTGYVNHDWNNPGNWVVIRSAGESPATFIPGLCTDVTIPSPLNVNYYPELMYGETFGSARCRNISMLDRAMLGNQAALNYTSASVEIKLKPSERDRFVTWSAPLMDMYSGDYHFRKDGQPAWGDVFMNMFNVVNPDYPGSNTPADYFNYLTSTFANRSKPLPLGTPFNLKVTSTGVTRDSLLRFPRSETNYDGATLGRASAGRFIADGLDDGYNSYVMPPPADYFPNTDVNMMQVVNPYMAYLSVVDFLYENPHLNFGYYMWDGEVGHDLSAFVYAGGGDAYRMIVSGGDELDPYSDGLIPPLQSFFVITSPASYYYYMASYLTTSRPKDSYNLRASVKSGGALKVTLSGAGKTAHAALVYEPGTSNFATDKIDMPAVTYSIEGRSPLSLYTFSTDMKPLAINASSMFDILPVALGLTANDPGEYALKFDGLYNLGYDVTLVDLALNKRVELSQSMDEYKFTLAKGSGPTIEVNNRFKLHFAYNGKGIIWTPVEPTAKPSLLKAAAERGYINISSSSGTIASLQVFNASGRAVYSETSVVGAVRIPAASGLHLVKATIGGETAVEKVIVK